MDIAVCCIITNVSAFKALYKEINKNLHWDNLEGCKSGLDNLRP